MVWWPSGGGLLPARIRHAQGGAIWAGLGSPTSRMLLFSLVGVTLCLSLQQQLRRTHRGPSDPLPELHWDERFPGVSGRVPEAAKLEAPQAGEAQQPRLEDSIYARQANKEGSEVLVQPPKPALTLRGAREANTAQAQVGGVHVAQPVPLARAEAAQRPAAGNPAAMPPSTNSRPAGEAVVASTAQMSSSSGDIGIFQYAEGMGRMDAVDSVQCYASRHGYKYFMDSQQPGDECSVKYAKSVFYRKHCYAARRLQTVRWLLVLDADSAIVSAGRRIEEWVDDSKDVVLYERWLSGELVAGNYLIKNSPAGHRFLQHWLDFYSIQVAYQAQKKDWFSNADNGALHLLAAYELVSEVDSPASGGAKAVSGALKSSRAAHPLVALMQAKFGQQSASIQECISLYGAANNLNSYDIFVACAKQMLVPLLKKSRSLKIFRRGHGFCIDDYVVANMYNPTVGPMCLHGVKAPVWQGLTGRIDTTKCKANPSGWEVPMQPMLSVSVQRLQQQLQMKEKVHTNSRPHGWKGTGGVGACWPNCPEPV